MTISEALGKQIEARNFELVFACYKNLLAVHSDAHASGQLHREMLAIVFCAHNYFKRQGMTLKETFQDRIVGALESMEMPGDISKEHLVQAINMAVAKFVRKQLKLTVGEAERILTARLSAVREAASQQSAQLHRQAYGQVTELTDAQRTSDSLDAELAAVGAQAALLSSDAAAYQQVCAKLAQLGVSADNPGHTTRPVT